MPKMKSLWNTFNSHATSFGRVATDESSLAITAALRTTSLGPVARLSAPFQAIFNETFLYRAVRSISSTDRGQLSRWSLALGWSNAALSGLKKKNATSKLRTVAGITVMADAASVGSDAGSIRHEGHLLIAGRYAASRTSSEPAITAADARRFRPVNT